MTQVILAACLISYTSLSFVTLAVVLNHEQTLIPAEVRLVCECMN